MHDAPTGLELGTLLAAAEDASPAEAVPTVARHLEESLGVAGVDYRIADAAGQALLRLSDGEQRSTHAGPVSRAWREQRVVGPDESDDGRWWVPVTVRGDALGLLEVHPGAQRRGDGFGRELATVAHLLGYLTVANQRHTDAYETARRSEPFDLAIEIQRRLLPQAFVCEGGSFSLAGWLEPSSTAGGDTFDYIASADRLSVGLVDAVGHDVRAAVLATLTVNALRNVRRQGADLQEQADEAHRVLDRHSTGEQFATGVLLELPLTGAGRADGGVACRVVNAGHPQVRRVRDGEVVHLDVPPDPPFGMPLPRDRQGYAVHDVELQPGDRLVLLTDGMFERSASDLDLDGLLRRGAGEHPRNAAQDLAAAFRDHVGTPQDDATFVILDWHGGTTSRRTSGGADS
ncbi:PP2C family protein-serine/threonine phosphatase [Nocardioides litoris]|uniref:PP2C family protein-serine/threonine phosphatase n=1 Tax=Nocardioides litoris TaxID=1926648 RepID=UPI001120338D|nr:PP2C family protein-serine/threonine phosphatase [Nocardioides litoris]